jgi:hypothetical protein
MEKLEMIEEYNKDGICVKRTINGYDLQSDTEPSIQIFKACSSISRKFFLTPEEVKERYYN